MRHYHIEPLREDDFDNLKRLSSTAWNYSAYTKDERIMDHAVKLDAHVCMGLCNDTLAVYDQDKLIGVVLAYLSVKKRPISRFTHYFKAFYHGLYLGLRNRESRTILKDLRKTEKAYQQMLKEAKLPYKEELVLFITHKDYQGQGIGKALIEAFENRLRQASKSAYYLFSDTSCNYGFYDHNGYERIQNKTIQQGKKTDEKTLDMFMYTKSLK